MPAGGSVSPYLGQERVAQRKGNPVPCSLGVMLLPVPGRGAHGAGVCVCVCAASHLLPEQVRAADFGFRSATQASSPSTPGSACSQVQPPGRERSSPWNCRPSSLPTAPACSGEREAGPACVQGAEGEFFTTPQRLS